MKLETFVARGRAAQEACDAILSLRVTSADLTRAEIRGLRRAMRVWAMTFRSARLREGRAHALFKAVGCRERANALERLLR